MAHRHEALQGQLCCIQLGQSRPETSGGDREAQNAQHEIKNISIPHRVMASVHLNCEIFIERLQNAQMPQACGLLVCHFGRNEKKI